MSRVFSEFLFRGAGRKITLPALCALLAGGGAGCQRKSPAAGPPEVNLDGFDPKIAAAIQQARSAVIGAPKSGAAWGQLGSVFRVHKFPREAVASYAVAETLDPREPRWPYFTGILLLAYDPDAAIPKIERAAELAGDASTAPRLRLALLLIERGRLDEAEKHLQGVLRLHPDDPQAVLAQGKLDLARGRLPEALQSLERSVASPHTAKVSQVLIATVQQRLGNSAAADEASRKAAGLPPDPSMADPLLAETAELAAGKDASIDRADRMLKRGEIEPALALLERAVADYPDDASAWQTLGWGRYREKNYPAAEKALRRALELAPDSAETHFELGLVLFTQGQPTAAAGSFRRSLKLRPDYPASHYNLGMCLEQFGDRAGAIESFSAAIRYEPNSAEAYKRLGANLALEGRFSEALEPLRRAVEMSPSDASAARMLERAKLRAEQQKVGPSP